MRSVAGWLQKRKEEFPRLGQGMITRKIVEQEMAKRGLQVKNGREAAAVDEEEELMRKLDSR
jgi:hypothetical protein